MILHYSHNYNHLPDPPYDNTNHHLNHLHNPFHIQILLVALKDRIGKVFDILLYFMNIPWK